MNFNISLLVLALVFAAVFLAVYGLTVNLNLKQKVRARAQESGAKYNFSHLPGRTTFWLFQR